MSKPISLQRNGAGGVDLVTERDAGNPVLILTGKAERSWDFWDRMEEMAKKAKYEIEKDMETEDMP